MDATQIRTAHDRIRDLVHRTPLFSSRLLSEVAGGPVWLKAENLQRVGAFKFRGALNAIRSLTPAELARGVTTYSSGNHGQAVALAARLAGARAVLFVPEDANAGKVAAARAYGAEIRFAGTTSIDRQTACEAAAAREGLLVVPPFDDPRIIAGQGTVGLEILEQAERVDEVLVPVGGGGLVAGIAAAVTGAGARVIGVEPVTADAMGRALAAGAVVAIDPPDTIADGLRSLRVGELNFAIARDCGVASLTVTDAEIRDAMRFLLTRARLVVEPSGAVGVAALLSGRHRLDGRCAVVVLSGGNADPALLAAVLSG